MLEFPLKMCPGLEPPPPILLRNDSKMNDTLIFFLKMGFTDLRHGLFDS